MLTSPAETVSIYSVFFLGRANAQYAVGLDETNHLPRSLAQTIAQTIAHKTAQSLEQPHTQPFIALFASLAPVKPSQNPLLSPWLESLAGAQARGILDQRQPKTLGSKNFLWCYSAKVRRLR